MRHHQHRGQPGFLALPDADQFLVEDVTRELVEGAEGLVEQKDIGIAHQRARQGGTLLHPAG
jgi:hypothetical protein